MLSFDHCNQTEVDFNLVGGKAFNLLFLRRHGFDVPNGFVIPTSIFAQFLSLEVSDPCDDSPEAELLTIGTRIDTLLSRLETISASDPDLLEHVRSIGATIRELILCHESYACDLLLSSLETHLTKSSIRYAVRSSGVAEDLPEFSFAGQMETFLNVSISRDFVGMIHSIVLCWSSLFSDRALSYRQTNCISSSEELGSDTDTSSSVGVGSPSSSVSPYSFPLICVVVQQMVRNVYVAGVVFTADPMSSCRSSVVINASFGLGEGIVSGLASPDTFWVNTKKKTNPEEEEEEEEIKFRIVGRRVGEKGRRVVEKSGDEGGIEVVEMENEEEEEGESDVEILALEEDQILELARIGRKIEKAYGGVPQDIEFAYEERLRVSEGEEEERTELKLWILQSRPITNLGSSPQYPRFFFQEDSEVRQIEGKRVFLNINYMQVMSDPVKPFGFSMLSNLLIQGLYTGLFHEIPSLVDVLDTRMATMNGHAYIDLTDLFNSDFAARQIFPTLETVVDSIAGKGLSILKNRGFFNDDEIPELPAGTGRKVLWSVGVKKFLPRILSATFFSNLERKTADLKNLMLGIGDLVDERLSAVEGSVQEQIHEAFAIGGTIFGDLFCQVFPNVLAGMGVLKVLRWLCPGAPFDNLSSGLLLNSKRLELALESLAVAARDSDGVIECMQALLDDETDDRDLSIPAVCEFLQGTCEGAASFIPEMESFSETWGMRAISEIDATLPRFVEDCSYLLRFCVHNVDTEFSDYSVEIGRGEQAVTDVVNYDWRNYKWASGNVMSFGLMNFFRSRFVTRLCRCHRALFALREEPKHIMMKVFFAVRQKVHSVVEEHFVPLVLDRVDDCHYLYQEELEWIGEKLPELGEDPSLRDLVRHTVFQRKKDHAHFKTVPNSSIPHLVTSDCERVDFAVSQEILKDLPPNFLAGCGVAPGVSVGPAKIILDPCTARIEKGDIIVAKQIDPAFSALFSKANALVSEVGGLMTHGSIVAREIGIPAVVCVMNACNELTEGQLIRVDGVAGTVEIILDEEKDEGDEEVEEEGEQSVLGGGE